MKKTLLMLLGLAVAACTPHEEAVTLRVGTYNLRMAHLDDNSPDNCWDKRCPRLIESFLKENMDLCAVEEVDSQEQESLPRLLAEKGLEYGHYFFCPYAQDGVGGRAQGLLWKKDRFEVGQPHFFWLSDPPELMQGNDHCQNITYLRGGFCMEVKDLKRGEARYFVMVTHAPLNKEDHARSAHIYVEMEKKFNPEQLPSFFLGDFNAHEADACMPAYRSHWKDAYYAAPEKEGPVGTYNAWNPESTVGARERRIDFVYFKGDGVVPLRYVCDSTLYEGCCPSDHFPVYTDFSFREPTEEETKARRMEWFSQAKLGIFIHWGIYSRGDWSESWAFHNGRVSMEDYFAQEADFTASAYHPEEWVKLIRESGAKYTVITSKHHDGFALWDTRAGDVSAVKTSAAGRDVLTPFVEEVRKQGGLKLGIYYSLIDWPREDYPNVFRAGPARYDIHKEPERWQHFLAFNSAQLKELNTLYKPDLYWFDGDWEFSSEEWDAPGIVSLLREDNPEVIVNSRIAGNGDYATPELGVPVVRPADRWWETCMTINDSWGFRKQDTDFKSVDTVLRMLVDCMSLGGNLLLDIGPRADGSIPEEEVAVLKELGRWTSKHAEAIYETRAGIPAGHVQAYTTLNKAGDILYLYFPYAPNESLEIKGLKSRIRKVRVVGTGEELSWKLYNDIDWSATPGVYYLQVPAKVLDPHMTVLAVELETPVTLYEGAGQVISFNE